MKNSHLFPALNGLMFIVVVSLLIVSGIRLSPIMLTVIIAATFMSGVIYHYKRASLTPSRIFELALLAIIVQVSAISFL